MKDSTAIGSYAELAHIYALSASVGKPVRSYFPGGHKCLVTFV